MRALANFTLSLPFFLFFFLSFLIFNFSFLLCVHVCVCVVCFSLLFMLFPPFLFFLFPFNRQKKEESLETKLLIALRVRSGCVVLSTSYTTYRTDLFCFVFFFLFLSYLSALYRVCTRVCVGGPPRTPAASLEKLEIIKADERTSTFSTPPDDSGTLCACVPI